MVPLGAEADAAFREIRDDLNRPLDQPVMLAAPDEWPDSPPVMTPLEAEPAPVKKAAPRPRKAKAEAASAPKAASVKAKAPTAKAKPRTARKTTVKS
jgi:sec-independent protein translocase protein TatB